MYAHGDGYIAYYTTADTASKRQCVSRAVAPSPVGPFVDDSTGPLICQSELGGTIDPGVAGQAPRAGQGAGEGEAVGQRAALGRGRP